MLKFKLPRRRSRLLRRYRRVAWISHGPCCQCKREINAGDEYEAYVVVIQKIQVRKFHVICPSDWHDDQDEEIRRIDEQEKQEERSRLVAA